MLDAGPAGFGRGLLTPHVRRTGVRWRSEPSKEAAMATRVQTAVQNALGSAVGWMRATSARDDRLSYLWLALGLALYPFATVRWTIPIAAWLVPIVWLRFVRAQPVLRGTLLVLLASALVLVVEMQGVVPASGAAYYLFLAGPVVLGVLPYLIDRLVVPRRGGLPGGLLESLVFPLGATTVAYLATLLSPNGSFGNLASTQYGDLPLLQLLSVTGLWGVVFLMSWFASLVNWAWEHAFAWPQVRGGTLLYGGLLGLVLLFGGARLALFPAQAQGGTVRVAGISPSRALSASARQQFARQVPTQAWMTLMMPGGGTQAERDRARAVVAPMFARAYAPLNDDLLARSEQQAHAGAKIIAWPEAGAQVLQEDEPALLARAGTLARATGAYLDMGIAVLLEHPGPSGMLLDQIVLIDPTGNVVWRYEKTHLVPGAETGMVVPGVDSVPTVQTPYGSLSNVVCFDGDFQGTMRQAGQAGADIMLVPSNDWREIDPIHSQMISLRAIENGYSLVRPTSNGLALTVDYQGRVLAASDYFAADPQVMVADVPVKGVRTVYSTIGDLFAWIGIAGLLALVARAVVQRRDAHG
jgi:apolipoprotein N-acyltransferase